MGVFFTSDTHFGDNRVLNLYPRPFALVAEMDAGIIERWNAAVGPEDDVWHLGDFARTAKLAAEILPRLNGRKHLTVSNNDPAPEEAHGWSTVGPYAEIEVEGTPLVLCHYPFRSWGAVNLHGHSHGRMSPLPRQFDVGVDVREYRPVTLAALLSTSRSGRTKRAT